MIHPSTLVSLAAQHPDPPDDVAQALCQASLYGRAEDFSEDDRKAIREFRAAAKTCYEKLSKATRVEFAKIAEDYFAKASKLEEAEKRHEEEMEAVQGFWEMATRSCVGPSQLVDSFDIQEGSWLGNGKWGWIMAAPKLPDKKRKAVIKLSDLRHADVTMKEWFYGYKMGKGHPNIVEYQSAFLYADENEVLKKRLLSGYSEGKLKSDIDRKRFPERYVCMTIELMNAGSVQGWLDKEILSPEGMLVTLRSVAAALAYMHENGVTHNDMKPENIFLHSDGRIVTVKLGDLGLAQRSQDRSSDVTRYGMTGFCMATGEAYGTRKYHKDEVRKLVAEVKECVQNCGLDGTLAIALNDLPELLKQVLTESVKMSEVRDWKSLQRWEFYDEGASKCLKRGNSAPLHEEEESPTRFQPASRRRSPGRDSANKSRLNKTQTAEDLTDRSRRMKFRNSADEDEDRPSALEEYFGSGRRFRN
eukprot:TRINITY_DN90664_c0_g1_i1.p1 TRINITY_DN90664_c0_g1~~TRINITY_DN90664_c0_g1_i1.p1  ORF type:complete len:474 (+),score=75.90 TRINITY_DN90664_c0_g1_i1:77-1498(+)